MPKVKANEVQLNYEEHGKGDSERAVVYIHGNLGCKEWMDLVWPLLPGNLRVIAIEWRGCGDSDKPLPDKEYANYTMTQHARDMIAAIQNLGLKHCDLCGHSTGGIIALHMMRMRPDLFGKLLVLDPIGPMGMDFSPEQLKLFGQMKDNLEFAKSVMATAMPTLFDPASVAQGAPTFTAKVTEAQKALFGKLVEKTRGLSDGIWFGTPINLAKEWKEASLRAQQELMKHPVMILWGELDSWIPREHMEEMAKRMPMCQLVVVPGVGHSMNVEQPATFAKHFTDFFASAVAGAQAQAPTKAAPAKAGPAKAAKGRAAGAKAGAHR
jgi:pimeloyl-ACP methyl ester carboxylesterase